MCFGATLFLENAVSGGCRSNAAFRLAIMRGEFSLKDLRKDDGVYGSPQEFIEGVTL